MSGPDRDALADLADLLAAHECVPSVDREHVLNFSCGITVPPPHFGLADANRSHVAQAVLAAGWRPPTEPTAECNCYPGGFTADTYEGPKRDCPVHGEPTAEHAGDTDEALARALLTIAEVESCVAKIERYLETNGRHLDLNARVPMERQTEAMREALNKWKAER